MKDQLNAAVAEHGLFFAPELSTSNRATIGGMISTDASGQGSVPVRQDARPRARADHRPARRHAVALVAAEAEELAANSAAPTASAPCIACWMRIRRDNAELIAERFPKLNRCVTGYDLVHTCDGRAASISSAVLCGAEGTLGVRHRGEGQALPCRDTPRCQHPLRQLRRRAARRRALMKVQAGVDRDHRRTVLALARGRTPSG